MLLVAGFSSAASVMSVVLSSSTVLARIRATSIATLPTPTTIAVLPLRSSPDRQNRGHRIPATNSVAERLPSRSFTGDIQLAVGLGTHGVDDLIIVTAQIGMGNI